MSEATEDLVEYADTLLWSRRARAGKPSEHGDPNVVTMLRELVDGVHAIGHMMIAQHRQRDEWAREALNILRKAKSDPEPEPCTSWFLGPYGNPLSKCILLAGHAGRLHENAIGRQWPDFKEDTDV